VVEASTPNGVSPDNHFWQAAHLAELGFVVHHAPTAANPFLPLEEIVAAAGDHAAGDRQPGA
jgi:predicted dienelactone hydrolase